VRQCAQQRIPELRVDRHQVLALLLVTIGVGVEGLA